VTIIGVIAVLCPVYMLNIPIESKRFIQHSPADSASSSGIVGPLTLVDDPQYAHEYDTRVQYIEKHLEMLRNETQADKAYIVSYGYDSSMREMRISSTFEAGQEGIFSQMRDFQGFSRRNWLRIKRDEQATSGLFLVLPQSYGVELYDEQGKPIGYLGIDYLQEKSSSWGNEMKLLRQTATSIKIGLLQPIEGLSSQEEK
jgi:hypothetical protein